MEERPRNFFKHHLKFFLRFGCTLLILIFLLRSVPWKTLIEQIVHLDPGALLICVALGFYGVVISSYQWQCLLDGEHIHVDLRRLINLYQVGISFNHFLPTGMGGDVIKAYYIGKEGKNAAGSASAVVMSRVTGFFGMVFISLPALLFWQTHLARQIKIGYVLSCLAMVSVFVLAFACVRFLPHFLHSNWITKRIVPSLLKLGMALQESARRPRTLWIATVFGMLYHIGYILNYYAYGLLLHISVPLAFYLVAIPFVSLIAFLPFSINGYGLREGAFVLIFSTVHVPMPTAILLVLLMDVQVLLFGLLGGGIYLLSGTRKEKALPAVMTNL
jgi:glycosyltransferase 2 family protein